MFKGHFNVNYDAMDYNNALFWARMTLTHESRQSRRCVWSFGRYFDRHSIYLLSMSAQAANGSTTSAKGIVNTPNSQDKL